MLGSVTKWSQKISDINPLANINPILPKINKQAIKTVERWAYKYPESLRNTEKMHWLTFQAMLLRNGDKYTTRRPPKLTYSWNQSL